MDVRFACVALAAVASQLACSFADFDVPTCTLDEQCEVLNRRDGISQDALERWQCARDNLCRKGPRDRDRDGDPDERAGGADCDDDPRTGSRRSGNPSIVRETLPRRDDRLLRRRRQ